MRIAGSLADCLRAAEHHVDADRMMLRHALINAVVHRDWSQDAALQPIAVDVVGQRITVSTSVGSPLEHPAAGRAPTRCSRASWSPSA